METISSKQNKEIKELKKLKTSKGRKNAQQYLIESWHLVEEAIKNLPKDQIVNVIATDEQFQNYRNRLNRIDVIVVSQEIADELSDTSTTQGIFAVIKMEPQEINFQDVNGAWLLLDNVQDPGNIGTMVRTADAAGFAGVVFGVGTASPYNGKVLRAMQGSQYHLPVVKKDLDEIIDIFKARDVKIFGSELNEHAKNYRDIEPLDDFGLIMGNEGNGMNKDLLDETDENLYIPIAGHAESLNVAVAAAVIMFRIKK